MSSSTTDKKMIELRSSDGETFVLDENVAVLCRTLKHMIENGCADNFVPIPNVTGNILSKVIEYCKRHLEPEGDDRKDELKVFDAEFVKVDQETLFDMILPANYLRMTITKEEGGSSQGERLGFE